MRRVGAPAKGKPARSPKGSSPRTSSLTHPLVQDFFVLGAVFLESDAGGVHPGPDDFADGFEDFLLVRDADLHFGSLGQGVTDVDATAEDVQIDDARTGGSVLCVQQLHRGRHAPAMYPPPVRLFLLFGHSVGASLSGRSCQENTTP